MEVSKVSFLYSLEQPGTPIDYPCNLYELIKTSTQASRTCRGEEEEGEGAE
jgi:hypothetical protein